MDTTRDLARLLQRAQDERDPDVLRHALTQALLGLGEADLIGLAPVLAGVRGALDGRWPGVEGVVAPAPIRRAS